MRHWFLCSLLLGAITSPAGATSLRVISTVPDLAAIAQEVGGPRVSASALLLPTQDPHFADARPHLALLLNRANLLLLVGLELEIGWLPTLLTGSRNPAIQKGSAGYLDVSSVVSLKEVPTVRIDRSMGDVHPGGNPHYLVDPENAIRVAEAVAARLAQLDPEGARSYAEGAGRFARGLRAARERWKRQLAPYQGTPVVTYHRSWVYFAEALGLRVVGELEPKPGIPPSASHVLEIIRLMRARRVPLLLQEDYYPDRTAQLVAQKTSAQLVVLPGGTDFQRGQRFEARLEQMVRQVVQALQRARR